MKIPFSWLREYLPTALTPEEVAEKLVGIGLEVEHIEKRVPSFSGVVVATVQEVVPHPQADKLRIATVYDGTKHYQVVCGAANCRAGIKVAFAPVGARLGTTTMKLAKLRGVASEGMLCARDELGLSQEESEGIMELPTSLVEGSDYAELCQDALLEISLTPNLAHCASVRGVARELAMVTQEKLEAPSARLRPQEGIPLPSPLKVEVEAQAEAPLYTCRLIQGVKVGPSPDWLRVRLEQCGMRSINNVVDITNLVLWELGQPLHAFDFAKIEGGVRVRAAREGEKFLGLDEKEYTLTSEMVVISDERRPLALAGLLGGKETEVNATTTTVLLESAYFDPQTVRRTARKLGISTHASYRFERGTDPNGVVEALDYATSWISELAGGVPSTPYVEKRAREFPPVQVTLRVERVNQILGTTLAQNEIETLLRRMYFGVHSLKGEKLHVSVPTYRHDVHLEVDLVEEVARLYGFDTLYREERAPFREGSLPHAPAYLFEQKVRRALIGEGLQEFLTCNLISPEAAEWVGSDVLSPRARISLRNPHSQAHSVLRPSLLPGFLALARHNQEQGIQALAGFEIGKIHFKAEEKYYEPTVLSLLLMGRRDPLQWGVKEREVDFFDLKGILENLFAYLSISTYTFRREQHANFHPGRQAAILVGNGQEVGMVGEVHPLLAKRRGLSHPLYFAELSLDALQQASLPEQKMKPLPLYPASVRDWTVTLRAEQEVGPFLEKLMQIPSKVLESVLLLDVYRNEHLGWSQKNVTFRFVYRDAEKTLSAEEVEREQERILRTLMDHGEIS